MNAIIEKSAGEGMGHAAKRVTMIKRKRRRTIESYESSDSYPYSSSPRVGAHTKEEGKEGKDTKTNSQLGRVARAGPLCAKKAILLVTVVADTFGKVATLEVRVNVFPNARRAGDPQNLALAALQEAITNYGPVVEQFAPIIYEPNATLLVGGAQFKRKITNRCE
jgi:hypothetical protein